MALLLDPTFHRSVVLAYFGLGVATLLALLYIDAPYGRHARGGWGPTMPSRLAWVVMESPAVFVFLAFYAQGQFRGATVSLALLGLWMLHYVQRTFVFPFLLRADGKRVPITVPAMAVLFNTLNAYVNATWIAHLHAYDEAWLRDPRFLLGVALFAGGYLVNRWADRVLRDLRKPGETGYVVPRGFLYEWVSCPNYLGEIVEWIGWAIATWSLAGSAFAFYTVANLLPRALANHRWYRQKFPDYPPERRALVPFLL